MCWPPLFATINNQLPKYCHIYLVLAVLTKESPYDEMTVAYKTGKGPYKVSMT